MTLEKLEKLLGIKFVTEAEGIGKFEFPVYLSGDDCIIYKSENELIYINDKDQIEKMLNLTNVKDLEFLTSINIKEGR